MATVQPPDPRTLTSWEDAFTTYPLPTIRTLETQLRKTIDENQQKLRSLVGTSYRDLLGTAERIIEMDAGVKKVEGLMGDVGRRCNSGMLEKVAGNHGRMARRRKSQGKEKEALMAEIVMLKSCIAFTRRVVRRAGDALLAAKVLVLARLLQKSVGESGGEQMHAVLEELKKKLAQARKKLLAYIARSLVQTHDRDTGDEKRASTSTVHTLCAYSLLTSSAPKDVLRYFLQVRFEQLESKSEDLSENGLLGMLVLYSQTLLDTREVFPRKFSDSLSQLSKVALVQDPGVSSVSELSLDVYGQWIADDVRNFHPWVRHDQISTSEVDEGLASWIKLAEACLLQGISDALKEQTDIDAVLDLRRKVVMKYLSLGARLQSGSHVQAINDLRRVFLTRLEELARDATKMSDFNIDAQTATITKAANMWDLSNNDLDQDRGAVHFRKSVIARQQGCDEAIASVIKSLNAWTERLQAFSGAITAMKATKWDDDLDVDLDDLADNVSLQEVLNKQDAQLLQSSLRKETALALRNAYARVKETSKSARNPLSLVRILREIDSRRHAVADMLESSDTIQADQSMVAGLHHQIAALTAESSIHFYTKRLRTHAADTNRLWDGTPALPVQPGPGSFRFLKLLHRSMSDAGSDIWSPDAVEALKVFANETLSKALTDGSSDSAKPVQMTNGHAADDDDHTEEEETTIPKEADSPVEGISNQFVQQLFDVLYLQRVLQTRSQNTDQLHEVVEELKRRSQVDATSAERLVRSASEYWKRTYLLFGLLADRHAP